MHKIIKYLNKVSTHAVKRAKERHNLDLNVMQLAKLAEEIEEGKHLVLKPTKKKSKLVLLKVGNKHYEVIYKTYRVVTFLPNGNSP